MKMTGLENHEFLKNIEFSYIGCIEKEYEKETNEVNEELLDANRSKVACCKMHMGLRTDVGREGRYYRDASRLIISRNLSSDKKNTVYYIIVA